MCKKSKPEVNRFRTFVHLTLDIWQNLEFLRFQSVRCSTTSPVTVFTALHAMQTRSSDNNSVRLSVRLSVCPSVRHTRALWQNSRKICPDLYTIRENIYPSFLRRRMVGAVVTPSTWNFGSTDPRLGEIADCQPIIARNSSVVTPSEKIQLTLIGSPVRAFQWA